VQLRRCAGHGEFDRATRGGIETLLAQDRPQEMNRIERYYQGGIGHGEFRALLLSCAKA
jgi:hypothetical protein